MLPHNFVYLWALFYLIDGTESNIVQSVEMGLPAQNRVTGWLRKISIIFMLLIIEKFIVRLRNINV